MNREDWLNECAASLAEHLLGPAGLDTAAETGEPLLERLRLSASWPSHRALTFRSRAVGQCWSVKASGDGTVEIMVSPYLEDAVTVAATLLHEMIHAAVGPSEGHGPAFKRAVSRVGLVGPATATQVGPTLAMTLKDITDEIGPYPHAKLDATTLPKQTTRLLKAVCVNPDCPSQPDGGYTVRITRKWAIQALPICGICEERMEIPSGKDAADEGEPDEGESGKDAEGGTGEGEGGEDGTGDAEGGEAGPDGSGEPDEDGPDADEVDATLEFLQALKEAAEAKDGKGKSEHVIDPDCGCDVCEAALTAALGENWRG